MEIQKLLAGIAAIGFGLYSMYLGILQVGRHELSVISRADSPALFWFATLGLILTGIIIALRAAQNLRS